MLHRNILSITQVIYFSREGDQNNDDSGPEADSNAFEDDVLQMALKMATEDLEEPAVDLEAALTPSTITATQTPAQPENIDNDGKRDCVPPF